MRPSSNNRQKGVVTIWEPQEALGEGPAIVENQATKSMQNETVIATWGLRFRVRCKKRFSVRRSCCTEDCYDTYPS